MTPLEHEHLSDYALDRLRQTSGGIIACEVCKSRMHDLQKHEKRNVSDVNTLIDSSKKRISKVPAPSRKSIWWASSGVAFAAAVTVVWSIRRAPDPILPTASSEVASDVVRIKGTNVRFFSKQGDTVQPGSLKDIYHPGDALRFAVTSPTSSYFVLFGIEASSRKFSMYFPFDGIESNRVEPGTDVLLPGSLILDNALGDEIFYGIFSNEPISRKTIEDVIQRNNQPLTDAFHLDLPGTHHILRIRKQP